MTEAFLESDSYGSSSLQPSIALVFKLWCVFVGLNVVVRGVLKAAEGWDALGSIPGISQLRIWIPVLPPKDFLRILTRVPCSARRRIVYCG